MSESSTGGSAGHAPLRRHGGGDHPHLGPPVRRPLVAVAQRLRFGAVSVERIRTPPSPGRDDLRVAAAPAQALVAIDVVTAGSVDREDEAGRYLQRAGEVAITSTSAASADVWRSSGGLIRSTIPLELVVEHATHRSSPPLGRMPDGAPTAGYVAFMTSLFDTSGDTVPGGVELERAVWWLQLALLRDVSFARWGRPQPELHVRVQEYIDAHLFDRDLSVSGVARALGISIRSVHNAFADRGVTAARSVRAARARAVAGSLRQTGPAPSNGALAAEFGFSSVDALQRAFVESFGVRVAEYRRTHAAEPDRR